MTCTDFFGKLKSNFLRVAPSLPDLSWDAVHYVLSNYKLLRTGVFAARQFILC